MASFALSFFLWPFLLPSAFHSFMFRRSIRTGKRPAWLVYTDDETSAGQWTLSDGTEFLDDLAFVGKARKAIADGLTVYYDSWW